MSNKKGNGSSKECIRLGWNVKEEPIEMWVYSKKALEELMSHFSDEDDEGDEHDDELFYYPLLGRMMTKTQRINMGSKQYWNKGKGDKNK